MSWTPNLCTFTIFEFIAHMLLFTTHCSWVSFPQVWCTRTLRKHMYKNEVKLFSFKLMNFHTKKLLKLLNVSVYVYTTRMDVSYSTFITPLVCILKNTFQEVANRWSKQSLSIANLFFCKYPPPISSMFMLGFFLDTKKGNLDQS